MTALPVSRHQYPEDDESGGSQFTSGGTPVLALKELVARLHREQNKIQNLLSSLGFALRSFNNLNQFLELIPLMATRVTDADGSALVLYKSNGQARLERLHCQEGQVCQDMRQALERATRQVKFRQEHDDSPQVQKYSSVATLDQQIKKYLESDIRFFGTPILVKNVERGRLYVFSSDLDYVWSLTRQRLVQLVADQTSVAIANNELTVELRKKERLDRELEIASEIQVHLLPSECPQIQGVEIAAACRTANRVGGDYYDFIPTNYDRVRNSQRLSSSSQTSRAKEKEDEQAACVPWSIVIGDVMGKGVPAGLIMTMTRGMLRAEVLNRHSPAQILKHLNRVMYDDLENSHRFVTLFYSEYDPQTKTLSYTNAAHNPPILWQAATNTLARLDTWGMLIGLDADSEYEDASVKLASGDTIIYYTDGFTDAVNKNGERFDEDNLSAAFQWACQNCSGPEAILNYLFEEVERFTGSGSQSGDDMTLVVMQLQS